MENKSIKIINLIFIMVGLLFLTNCSKKKDTSTNPEEISLDNVDVLMIDSWDRYQLVENRSEYPSLIAENYLQVFKHEII